jgi:hypothetical protein
MAKKEKIEKPKARRYRDARTGRFVTKKFAKKNRKTTVREPVPSGHRLGKAETTGAA